MGISVRLQHTMIAEGVADERVCVEGHLTQHSHQLVSQRGHVAAGVSEIEVRWRSGVADTNAPAEHHFLATYS